MAEQYTIEAVLKARDAGFSAGLKAALGTTQNLGEKVKSGLGFGIFQAIGMKAVNGVTGSISGMTNEMASSQAAWKTFEGNMKNFGMTGKIKSVRKELQKFAEDTIYSSSDMATTYAQLAAVGVKGANKLVTGFGGIASAAENPQQAMKTLSVQATQMAAKPTVQWMDFKLMLEQTPAGISAVAKAMGKTSKQLISDVQAGKIKTEDFFNAISKVGNSDAWQKQARQYKTVDQALDGLKETAANKLAPVFNAVTKILIDDISKLADAMGKVNFEKMGAWITEHEGEIRTAAKSVSILAAAFVAMKVVNSVAGTLSTFVGGIKILAGGGLLKRLIPNLFGTAAGEEAVGKASKTSAKDVLAMGAAFLLMGAGVALIAGGFYILANAATMVASAGMPAMIMFGLMVVGIAALMVVASKVGATMTAGAIGFIAFGAALLIAGAGMFLMAKAAVMLSSAGTGAIAVFAGMFIGLGLLMALVTALGPGLIVGAVGFLIFAAALVVAGVGLLLIAKASQMFAQALSVVGQTVVTVLNALSKGFTSFGNAVKTILDGISGVIKAFGNAVTSILKGVARIFDSMGNAALNAGKGVQYAAAGFKQLADIGAGKVVSSCSAAAYGLSKIKGQATGLGETGRISGNAFASGLQIGFNKARTNSNIVIRAVVSKLRNGYSSTKAAGAYIAQGFANGMESQLGRIQSAANKMVVAADKAVTAKAKIGSPSRLFKTIGHWIPAGLAGGILSGLNTVKKATEKLVMTPILDNIINPMRLSMAGVNDIGNLNQDYSYGGGFYQIEVPLNVDGKEFARATSAYYEDENNRKTRIKERQKGRR